MRGKTAGWMNQRAGFASPLSVRRVAPLLSWWIGVERSAWAQVVRARWRCSDAAGRTWQQNIDDV